ncbi:hypothetical protein GCM10010372_07590 [Streptomyces tauricus]|nr:hypothetical protein GCM10010372_07590 [Streptomyces tauricus]
MPEERQTGTAARQVPGQGGADSSGGSGHHHRAATQRIVFHGSPSCRAQSDSEPMGILPVADRTRMQVRTTPVHPTTIRDTPPAVGSYAGRDPAGARPGTRRGPTGGPAGTPVGPYVGRGPPRTDRGPTEAGRTHAAGRSRLHGGAAQVTAPCPAPRTPASSESLTRTTPAPNF